MSARPTRQLVWIVLCLALAIGLPVSPVQPQTCGAAQVTYEIEGAVVPEYVDNIKEAIAVADAYFTEVFGRTVCIRLVIRVFASAEWRPGVTGESGLIEGRPAIYFATAYWAQASRAARLRNMVHEYFHTLQNELAFNGNLSRWREAATTPRDKMRATDPRWLNEGSAEFIAAKAVDWKELAPYQDRRAVWITNVKNAQDRMDPLSSMELGSGFILPGLPTYSLGALATEFLTRNSGPRTLAVYYEAAGRARWEQAFQAAFGMSPADFYREFEEYRKTL